MLKLSIIVATFNAARTLERCLLSITEQTFRDWEILIPDGGSTDGTVELIRRQQAQISWWQTRKDRGIYDAWNQALEHARGEYICFLGADDSLVSPQTLQEVFDLLGGRKFELITGKGLLLTQSGQVRTEFGHAWSHRKIARRMTICHPGSLHRRDLFERFGNFDTDYRICADYDFLLRLPAELTSLHLSTPLVNVEDSGISRKRMWLMLRERYQAQANCPRIGPLRAAINYLDKLWRIPVARVLGIPN